MLPKKEQVPASEDPEVSSVVTPDMLQKVEGVAPVKPVTPAQETMPGKEPEDVEALRTALEQTRQELADIQKRSQDDMNALRSTLERGRYQALAAKDQELEEADARMHAAITRNMDEAEALKYTNTILEQKVQMLKDRGTEAEQRLQAQQNMDAWTRGFMQMGVNYDQIDRSSPESCIQSGYAALEQNRQRDLSKITELENTIRQLQAAKEAEVTPQPKAEPRVPEAPPTLGTQIGKVPSQTKTIGELLTSLQAQLGYKVTEDEMWSMINSGQLSQDILSGLIVS